MQLGYVTSLTALAMPEKSLDGKVTGKIHSHTPVSSMTSRSMGQQAGQAESKGQDFGS